MKILIDTSNQYLILSLIDQDYKVLDFLKMKCERNLTEVTNSEIQKILDKNKISFKDISSFYVVNGPGSFTGVKTSVLIANTVKNINPELKIFSLSSLEFLKKNRNDKTAIDAKGGKYYYRTPYRIKLINENKIKENWITTYEDVNEENITFNIRRFHSNFNLKPLYKKRVV